MSTPEEELEAGIWEAMRATGAIVSDPLRFIALLTFAAQRYAAGDSQIVAGLRQKVADQARAEARRKRRRELARSRRAPL